MDIWWSSRPIQNISEGMPSSTPEYHHASFSGAHIIAVISVSHATVACASGNAVFGSFLKVVEGVEIDVVVETDMPVGGICHNEIPGDGYQVLQFGWFKCPPIHSKAVDDAALYAVECWFDVMVCMWVNACIFGALHHCTL